MNDVTRLPQDQALDFREFRAESISLIGGGGDMIDISRLVLEITLRQDIFTNYINGECLVSDGVDLMNLQGIHGSEFLYLHLKEPGSTYKIKKAFRIYKISGREAAKNNSQVYTLHFVSDEMVASSTKRISRAYSDRTISDIVKDILSKELAVTNTIVDDTDTGTNLVIPSLRPTEALNWLASRATNGDDSFAYLFYENLDGFNFRSLQSMYEDKEVNSKPFVYEYSTVERTLADHQYYLDAFTFKRDFDVLTLIRNGGLGIHFTGFDPIRRTININEYSVKDIPKMYDIPPIVNFDYDGTPHYDASSAYQVVYPQTTEFAGNKPIQSEIWMKRVMSVALLSNSLLELVMPGNMSLQAGKPINVQFKYMITPTTDNMTDNVRSGKYLVTAVVHRFNVLESQFDSVLVCGRDSLPVAPVKPKTDLPFSIRKLSK